MIRGEQRRRTDGRTDAPGEVEGVVFFLFFFTNSFQSASSKRNVSQYAEMSSSPN